MRYYFFFFFLPGRQCNKYIVTLKVQNIPENINPTNHPGFVLTELKHKNSIIYLEIFRKQAKFAYLFLWKTMLQPVILFWNVHSVSECLFLFWTVWFRPLPIYPIAFQHPRLPVGRKQQRIAAMEVSKQTGSEIADSTRLKMPRHPSKKLYEQRNIKAWINQLINFLSLATHWGGGGREKQLSPIFRIWTSAPISTTSCQYYILHL